ncbi:MAG TPA: glycoside hydrolase family 2 TIM barrel-domain containing protein [Abditibacteriaceae bacterium]|jgi:beta-galactosidase
MKTKHFLLLTTLMTASSFAMTEEKSLAQGQVLLPEGNFEQADAANKPTGWQLSSPTSITLAGDAANRWVQMRDDGSLIRDIKLDPSWKKIVISARFKMSDYIKGPEGWQRPHIALRFLDDAGQPYGDYVPTPEVHGNTDWTIRRVSFDIPVGARQLRMQPGLWGTKGLLELDDIVVKAYTAGATLDPEPAVDAPWPSTVKTRWGDEAVQVLSPRRSRVSLNGAWKFSPALSNSTQANAAPQKGWGYIQVPGSWRNTQHMLEGASGPQWAALDINKLSGAWYERRIKIPADWNNSHISIDFKRISTDATFWVNDKPAGKVNWPEGELDITDLVKPGEEVTLRAFVVATIDEGEVMVLMGTAPGQNWTAKKQLHSGGIVGDVTLQRRPRGAHVSDVYIKPSTRKKQLGVDIELSGVTQAGPIQLVASLRDENGREEKRFTQTIDVNAAATQRVQANWAWDNPRLWDVDQPNLYHLHLSVQGAGVDDEPVTRFGFRETWIEGRQVFLNGTPFRIRPTLMGSNAAAEGGVNVVKEKREMGFNFGEQWPGNVEERSQDVRHTDLYDITDRTGFPVSGIMPHMDWMANALDTPDEVVAYRAATERIARRYRNHPSIIIWGTSGNMFGGSLDPAHVGNKAAARLDESVRKTETGRVTPRAEMGIGIIKAADPTRPVFIHNGGSVGDIYTINHYLNFIPLQEREEWLSAYAQKGDMPLMYVEYGTPVSISVMRGRNGFQGAFNSENLLSEYTAIYLGNEAYKLEPADYRRRSAEIFQKDQTHGWSLGMRERDYAPNWLKLQDLFMTNTWRSWRTMGISGGMIPWDNGYARLNGKLTVAGEALRANNSETLAWIAGAAQTGDNAAFTAKDHSFFAGETIRKQIALLNDSRKVQKYSVRWTVTQNSQQKVSQGEKNGEIAVGQTLFLPFEFKAPATTNKVGGEIVLNATIGEIKHTDRFAFRVWPRAVASRGTVIAFDPEGKTTAMLRALGYTVQPWNGRAGNSLLVIGRNALKSGISLPGDLKGFVQNGGRVLLSGHDPHWLRENMGVRVSYHQSRRMWKVGDNAATAGLDEADLRDWRGHSTMLNPRPDYLNTYRGDTSPDIRRSSTQYPYAGWRWSNRGTVSSAAIEKPHRTGWRPLLEGEFDMAYSPLMELDFGNGKLIWSQLDLEDHAGLDPAAQRLARQVIQYSTKAPLAPRVNVNYIGGEGGSALLRSLDLQFKTVTSLPASGVVVVGADATISDAQLEIFARSGGKVLFLARQNATGAAGLQLQEKTDFLGSLQAPNWPEARGLSASDLRWRNAGKAWLAASGNGWEVAADGLLARRAVGIGVMLWSQLDPTAIPADEKTYFRLTRWRQTRALSQVLANLGASFQMDERIFSPRAPRVAEKPIAVSLAGDWRAKQIQRLDASPSADKGWEDKGISEEAKRAVTAGFDDSKWQVVSIPNNMDSYGNTWDNADGEAVFRKTIEVPKALQGQDLKISLGSVDDYDETYFNGVRVGGIGKEHPTPWSAQRDYVIPANLIKPGKNVIAVRVWDRYGGGGITARDASTLLLQSPRAAAEAEAKAVIKAPGFYHPDYREDFELGDEPYRYYNW